VGIRLLRAICFLGVGESRELLVKRMGEKVVIECIQNMDHERMFWYRQDPVLGLQLLHFSFSVDSVEKRDVPDGSSVSRKKKEGFPLTLESASASQMSVHLCAHSESTARPHPLCTKRADARGGDPKSGLSCAAPTARVPIRRKVDS
uniref:Immunoglobulin V-set domain-containing protein n=1 Tax=Monodon monoceros TaxID=40151 RepID=A0A8C6BLC2_MONMO